LQALEAFYASIFHLGFCQLENEWHINYNKERLPNLEYLFSLILEQFNKWQE
jgi:hypothetical protein